jgi:hypothetical protein
MVPRALAMFNGGNALATVVAAPVGSYLGAMIGWRGAFFCLVPIAAVAFVWQWFTLPSMPPRQGPSGSGNILMLLKSRLVMFGTLAVGVFFMGQFALFTYLRPFLETVTRVDVSTLSLILLALGHRRLRRHHGHRLVPEEGRLVRDVGRHPGGDGGDRRGARCRRCFNHGHSGLADRVGLSLPRRRRWAGGCGWHDLFRTTRTRAAASWWRWFSSRSRSAPRSGAFYSTTAVIKRRSSSVPACC